ncbi:MAG: hypothetical protein Kow0029_23860 [Candidatus Rifleibacteriota bacterium]
MISIRIKEKTDYQIKILKDGKKIFDCLNELVSQYNIREKFLSSLDSLTSEERSRYFIEMLSFSARPYVWAAEALLAIARQENITDIHFEPVEKAVKISYRSSGLVQNSLTIGYEKYSGLLSRLKFLAGCLSHISDKAQEGAFRDDHTRLDVRVSTFPTDFGERLSLRIISPLRYDSLESLGWSESSIQAWRREFSRDSGLMLISGAVGSGKTTALYATLAELANSCDKLRVVTLEDPVEGRISSICQSSLDSMKGLTLAQAFKHLLRQDPDVIALGEIRDRECLREALQAGLSGHRVLATFHAGSAEEAFDRIKQMGIDEYMVLSGLKSILHLDLKRSNGYVEAKATLVKKVNKAQA